MKKRKLFILFKIIAPLLAAGFFQACETGDDCNVSMAPEQITVDADGSVIDTVPSDNAKYMLPGKPALTVSVSPNCSWTPKSDADWVSIPKASAFTGSGTFNYSIAPNLTGMERTASITVKDKSLLITQTGDSSENGCQIEDVPQDCPLSISPSNASISASGGNVKLNILSLPSCSWEAAANKNWISPQASNGNGNTTVSLAIAPNSGPQRSAIITVKNQSFSITQDGSGGCGALSFGPSSMIVNAAGSTTRKISVFGDPACSWTAASNDPWISISAGTSGSGNGVITIAVEANPGASTRTGALKVGNQTVPIFQDGTGNLVHPRLWMTPADQQRLAAWAIPSNPMYQQGLSSVLQVAISKYDQYWPTGQPIPFGLPSQNWTAQQDQGSGPANYSPSVTEAYAEFFAFMSLIDPDPIARDAHARRARNMLMFIMNQAVLGVDNSPSPAPFRDIHFATYNRAGFYGEAFGLIVDWLYPSGVLTPQDKQTIQKVFMRWAGDNLVAATSGNEHPQPLGVMNDPQLLGSGANPSKALQAQLRWTANNYYSSHARNLTLMALSLDPSDDPAVDPNQPASSLGNTLRSYIKHVTGAWLYQQYAVYERADVVKKMLNVPGSNPSLGIASGGLSVEGFLYGTSLGYVFEELLALHTAGYDDVDLSGPQINLISSSYWDSFVDGFLSSISPAPKTFDPPDAWLGPLYSMASYGENLDFYVTPNYIVPFASIGVFDQIMGQQQRLNKSRWIATNALQGGLPKLYSRVDGTNIWNNSNATQAILYYMLFDPTANPPDQVADPRPSIATDFYSPSWGRILSRSDWSPDASFFSYLANWQSLSHQNSSAGQFEFHRKGEWLTKEWSGYSNDNLEPTPLYHNVLSLENNAPNDADWFESGIVKYGGQWIVGRSMGDPKTTASFGPGYVYAFSDLTDSYNRSTSNAPNAAVVQDILHASRSIVWLKPDHIIVYDRALSMTANRFKRFNLVLVDNPKISDDGKLATIVTSGGQNFYVQNLLPSGAKIKEQHFWTSGPATEFNKVSTYEPARYRLVIEDPSNPSDIRFLHVLQGSDPGAPQTSVQAIQSKGGTPFDGALVGTTAVLFAKNVAQPFESLTYSVASTTSGHMITGLVPNSGYDVTQKNCGKSIRISIVPGKAFKTDDAGVLVIGTP